jgi:hypothetical protein
VRPGAGGRLRRTARMLIAAACAAAMLAAASAGAAPAYAAVPAASAGAARSAVAAQTVSAGPARGLSEPAARVTAISAMAATSSGSLAPSGTPPRATANQASPTHSRTAWGRAEIAAGVLIICFAVLAVQAARRRGR